MVKKSKLTKSTKIHRWILQQECHVLFNLFTSLLGNLHQETISPAIGWMEDHSESAKIGESFKDSRNDRLGKMFLTEVSHIQVGDSQLGYAQQWKFVPLLAPEEKVKFASGDDVNLELDQVSQPGQSFEYGITDETILHVS